MKILPVLTFCVLPFLAGCVTRTPAPGQPVDWSQVVAHVAELTAVQPVDGPLQNRGQAETGQQLWDLALALELAKQRSDNNGLRVQAYITDVAAAARQAALPPCTWRLRLLRTPCRAEK